MAPFDAADNETFGDIEQRNRDAQAQRLIEYRDTVTQLEAELAEAKKDSISLFRARQTISRLVVEADARERFIDRDTRNHAELAASRRHTEKLLDELAEAKKDTALLDAIDALPQGRSCLWDVVVINQGSVRLSRSFKSREPEKYQANIRAALAYFVEVK